MSLTHILYNSEKERGKDGTWIASKWPQSILLPTDLKYAQTSHAQRWVEYPKTLLK